MNLQRRNEDMREFFAEKSEGYDEVHSRFMQSKQALAGALPDGVCRVLDLGAGTGLELVALFERFPEARVTAIDLTVEMLEQLKRRPFADRVDIIVGDFFSVDFSGPYDAVISTSALHHFVADEKLPLYRKIFDCLAPGGIFLNSDRCLATLEEETTWLEEVRTNGHNYRHLDIPLSMQTEEALLREAGFVEISMEKMPETDYRLVSARRARGE